MNTKLNTKTGLIASLLYIVISIAAAFIAAIFFGGVQASPDERVVDGVIDSGMIANIAISIGLLYVCFVVFKDSTRDIFFERKRFNLSKLYYLFPLTSFAVILFALTQVDYSAYSLRVILLVLLATLSIGFNEEVVTRGILLVGLRNSKWDEWKAWVITVIVFSLMHMVNVFGGGFLTVLLIVIPGGTLWYVSRRVFNNVFVSIALHALYDTAFYLLPGKYLVNEPLPGHILDIQLGSFLVSMVASILFVIFGRGLLINRTTGWSESGATSK